MRGAGHARWRSATAGQLRVATPQLLKLDFRNGPLRKKYDAVKYAVRKLETLLYELSLTKRTDVSVEEGGDADAAEAAD